MCKDKEPKKGKEDSLFLKSSVRQKRKLQVIESVFVNGSSTVG